MIGSGARKLIREEPSYYYNLVNNFPKNCYSPYIDQIEAVFFLFENK
jgi:hypothetical protein